MLGLSVTAADNFQEKGDEMFFSILLALIGALAAIVPSAPALPEDGQSSPSTYVEPQGPPEGVFALTVDGEYLPAPVEPFYCEDELYIPLKEVSEALGDAQVLYDPDGGSVTVTAPGLELHAAVGELWLDANGRCLYVPGAVQEIDGCCMVPAGALAMAFGAFLFEDREAKRAELTPTGQPIEPGDTFYGEEDLYWLSRIIDAEARGEPFEGKIAVGNVVMNRVFADGFPDTVEGVIFDRRCGIQFSPAYSGSINRDPTEDSINAAKIALEGTAVVPTALFFSPSSRANTCWASKHRPFLTEIGRHVFFG